MDPSFEVLAKVSTPLAVAGLAVAGFVFIYRQLASKVQGEHARLILDRSFAFSLIIAILALGAWVAVEWKKAAVQNEKSRPSSTDLGSLEVSLDDRKRTTREILLSLAEQVGAGTALSKDLKGLDDTMALSAENSKLSDVLNDLCTSKGWSYTLQSEPRPVILVVPAPTQAPSD